MNFFYLSPLYEFFMKNWCRSVLFFPLPFSISQLEPDQFHSPIFPRRPPRGMDLERAPGASIRLSFPFSSRYNSLLSRLSVPRSLLLLPFRGPQFARFCTCRPHRRRFSAPTPDYAVSPSCTLPDKHYSQFFFDRDSAYVVKFRFLACPLRLLLEAPPPK